MRKEYNRNRVLFIEIIKQSRCSIKTRGYLTTADGTDSFYSILGEGESVLNFGNLLFRKMKFFGRIPSYVKYGAGVTLNIICEGFKEMKLRTKLVVKDVGLSEEERRHFLKGASWKKFLKI